MAKKATALPCQLRLIPEYGRPPKRWKLKKRRKPPTRRLPVIEGQASVLSLVPDAPSKKERKKKDWSKNPLQLETWTLDAQYCRDSKQNCEGCEINIKYNLKEHCKMPESVKLLQSLEADGVKLYKQKDHDLIIQRKKKSVYEHI